MLDDQQLGDTLTQVLHEHRGLLEPPADLAEKVIRRRHRDRQRARIGGTLAIGSALAVALTFVLANPSRGSARLGSARLHLAGYSFELPRGAHNVSATPAACAIGVGVAYAPGAGEGATAADEPSIAQAATSDGGCVAMLLTDPYTPGAANAPQEPFTVVDQHPVQIGSYAGTVGTYAVTGSGAIPGSDMTFDGTSVPSGTQHVELNIPLPASSDGEVQDLQVAVAGLSEQQLVAIVSSGLTGQVGASRTR